MEVFMSLYLQALKIAIDLKMETERLEWNQKTKNDETDIYGRDMPAENDQHEQPIQSGHRRR